MEDGESQLRWWLDGCDSASSGYLDRDHVMEEEQHSEVKWEEFQKTCSDVLSEDDSSYLEPVVPEEVQPKFVSGLKRYGRRSRPEFLQKTRSRSLESLKMDDEPQRVQSSGDEQEEDGGGREEAELHPQVSHCGPIRKQDRMNSFYGSAPMSCSTPTRSHDLHRTPLTSPVVLDVEDPARLVSPALLTVSLGQRVLSRLDDGSGFTSPERVLDLWTEEGLQNSRDILQVLDFSLDEPLSLSDLRLALDNEVLLSGNRVHQAALISYRNQVQHLQEEWEAACSQRDKLKLDLDQLDQRNLKLVRELDDRHVTMETLNQSRIRELQQDYRDRLLALRSRTEQETEALLQQGEREREELQEALRLLRAQEAELQEELSSHAQENLRLLEELNSVKLQLSDSQRATAKLERELQVVCVDPAGAELTHEEKFSRIINDYELQCRELRDRNDELSSELEFLKNRRRIQQSGAENTTTTQLQLHTTDSDSDDSDMKRSSSPVKGQETHNPGVSIQTELALEQLKQKHDLELQQLNIQLETQVNYYERSLELMRQSMEVERKDISQAFKMEISELEEQKSEAEQQVKQLKEMERLRGGAGGAAGALSTEQQRSLQRERAELEQNFATEIRNLVEKLSSEKEELEEELLRRRSQEEAQLRTQLEEVQGEKEALEERLRLLQQEVQRLEEEVQQWRRRQEETQEERERSREEEEKLMKEGSRLRQEVLDLSVRNLDLSSQNAELSARLHGDQEAVRLLRERLETVSKDQEEEGGKVRRLQDEVKLHQREKLQLQNEWKREREVMERERETCREQRQRQAELQVELSSVSLKLQWLENDNQKLTRENQETHNQVERLQHSLFSLEKEAELLRSQLQSVNQEKVGHAHQGEELQRRLQEAQSKVEDLEKGVARLREEKAELRQQLDDHAHKLRVQNQELQNQVQELQIQNLQVQNLTEEQKNLKRRLKEEEADRSRAQDQGQYEKALSALQQRTQELEVKLKATKLLLQEKQQELKEEVMKASSSSSLLKDVYLENSHLMRALQVTERRQKTAEKKNSELEEKIRALTGLLREVVPTLL